MFIIFNSPEDPDGYVEYYIFYPRCVLFYDNVMTDYTGNKSIQSIVLEAYSIWWDRVTVYLQVAMKKKKCTSMMARNFT